LRVALQQLDPCDFNEYGKWFALAGACKALGISREAFCDWSAGDPEYVGDRQENERIWDSARGEHGGALYNAISASVLTPGSPRKSAKGNLSPKPRRTFNWRSRVATVIGILHAKQDNDTLFWVSCVCAEINAECGKPTLDFARKFLEDNCPKFIEQVGIDEVRRIIQNGFDNVAEKLKEQSDGPH
jgi:hypothetical protein